MCEVEIIKKDEEGCRGKCIWVRVDWAWIVGVERCAPMGRKEPGAWRREVDDGCGEGNVKGGRGWGTRWSEEGRGSRWGGEGASEGRRP